MKNIHQRRYLGNKYKLLPFIEKEIINNCKGSSFCDLFAGTGVVSNHLYKHYKDVYINDFLVSNFLNYKTFFKTSGNKINEEKCQTWVKNKILISKENYFSKNFADTYFSYEDCIKIGTLREELEKEKFFFTTEEYNWILTSLIYSVDKASRSVGHFEAYLRNHNFKLFNFEWVNYNYMNNIKIFNQDVFDFVDNMKHSDIVYIDPPYNSRQYDRAYHVLENIALWNKPTLYGVARKPESNKKTRSVFSTSQAQMYFDKLIDKLILKSNFIVISYNNTYNPKSNTSKNKIEFDDMKNTLERYGKLKVKTQKYNAFQSGKTDMPKHEEILFILEVINDN